MNTANEHEEQDGAEVAAFHDGMLDAFWAEYSQRCIAWDAEFAQRLNMKQAFIAGATSHRLAMGAAMRDGGDAEGMTANCARLDDQLAAMAGSLLEDAMTEFGNALDENHPRGRGHDVRFVDGTELKPEQVEELDAIIRAAIARFAHANGEQAQ